MIDQTPDGMDGIKGDATVVIMYLCTVFRRIYRFQQLSLGGCIKIK